MKRPLCTLSKYRNTMFAVCEFHIAIEERCEWGYGRVCANPVMPEAHQNDRSYVCELSWPIFDSLCKNLASWAVTQRVSKNSWKWRVGACLGQYGTTSPAYKAMQYNSISISCLNYTPRCFQNPRVQGSRFTLARLFSAISKLPNVTSLSLNVWGRRGGRKKRVGGGPCVNPHIVNR